MNELKIYKDIDITKPVMIAGWPGMGSVALGVVEYLRKKLNTVRFAEIRVDSANTIDSVVVEAGIAAFPPNPQHTFYYTRNPNLIIFEGQAQLPGRAGIELLNSVINLAVRFNVTRIYTSAAFPVPISYRDTPQVYFAANNKKLLNATANHGIQAMEGGHISGLNGLLLGFTQKKIDAICLLATMPQYAVNLPNPKASSVIIEALCKMVDFEINMDEMGEYVRDMEEKMSVIEDKVKDVLTIEKEPNEAGRMSEKKIPEYILEKIERLFHDAENDKGKALMLKKELDRWDLYKAYEDRFLDLFKETR